MGHSGPGAVNQREALKSCGETDRQTAEQCHLISSRFRSIARSYFRKAHGVLLLYDVTSEKSFLSVRAWADQVQVTVKKVTRVSQLAGMSPVHSPSGSLQDSTEDSIPMCVVGNKVDLREQRPEGSCVSTLQGEKLAKVCCDFHSEGKSLRETLCQIDGAVFVLRPQAYGALFCETSAKDGTNIVEAVLHLAR